MTSVWLKSGTLKEGGNGKGKEKGVGEEEILSPMTTSLDPLPHPAPKLLQSLGDISFTHLPGPHLLTWSRLPMG